MEWDFELQDTIKELKNQGIRKVFIQLPEGLKIYARKIMDELDSHGIECVLSGDPCYGACDLKTLRGYTTLHFGHVPFFENEHIYIPVRWKGTPMFSHINIRNKHIGILTTIQYEAVVDKLRVYLERAGNKVTVGGTVLGCDWKNTEKVKSCDVIIFVGTGVFHPKGIAYHLKREILTLNPITGKVNKITWYDWEKDSIIRKAKAEICNTFGVVVSTKPGQMKLELAKRLEQRLKESGKKVYLIVMDEITPEKLDYLPFDCFVITACPRIVFDDWKNYKKPIILPEEIPRE